MQEIQCPWCYAMLFVLPPCETRCHGCKNRVVVDENSEASITIVSK